MRFAQMSFASPRAAAKSSAGGPFAHAAQSCAPDVTARRRLGALRTSQPELDAASVVAAVSPPLRCPALPAISAMLRWVGLFRPGASESCAPECGAVRALGASESRLTLERGRIADDLTRDLLKISSAPASDAGRVRIPEARQHVCENVPKRKKIRLTNSSPPRSGEQCITPTHKTTQVQYKVHF